MIARAACLAVACFAVVASGAAQDPTDMRAARDACLPDFAGNGWQPCTGGVGKRAQPA
jgi:hypothetical protein